VSALRAQVLARTRAQIFQKKKIMTMTDRRVRMLLAMSGIEFSLKQTAIAIVQSPPPSPKRLDVVYFSEHMYSYGRNCLLIDANAWNFTEEFRVPAEHARAYETIVRKFKSFDAAFVDIVRQVQTMRIPLEDVLRNSKIPEEKKAKLREFVFNGVSNLEVKKKFASLTHAQRTLPNLSIKFNFAYCVAYDNWYTVFCDSKFWAVMGTKCSRPQTISVPDCMCLLEQSPVTLRGKACLPTKKRSALCNQKRQSTRLRALQRLPPRTHHGRAPLFSLTSKPRATRSWISFSLRFNKKKLS
jgi:hypothetical protein